MRGCRIKVPYCFSCAKSILVLMWCSNVLYLCSCAKILLRCYISVPLVIWWSGIMLTIIEHTLSNNDTVLIYCFRWSGVQCAGFVFTWRLWCVPWWRVWLGLFSKEGLVSLHVPYDEKGISIWLKVTCANCHNWGATNKQTQFVCKHLLVCLKASDSESECTIVKQN